MKVLFVSKSETVAEEVGDVEGGTGVVGFLVALFRGECECECECSILLGFKRWGIYLAVTAFGCFGLLMGGAVWS